MDAGKIFLLCGCIVDENVASLAEIEVQFMQGTNMCSID